jgi:sugar/nucleoside kinase (ribokinase family)
VHLVPHLPGADEKVTARAQTVAAGGPAANAAVTFGHLGGAATLLTAIGAHPLAAGIAADLAESGVRVVDPAGDDPAPPAVSTVLVTAGTGERAVSSVNATGRRLTLPASSVDELIAHAEVTEFDGHHMELATTVARAARAAGRRTVFDGGSWKPGTAELLRFIDVAVCSADFHPPGTSTPHQALDFLTTEAGVPYAAVTRGGAPILWAGPGGGGELAVAPAVRVADTLGAGDVLHGALVHALPPPGDPLTADAFRTALAYAAAVATASCASFGTRAWMRGAPGAGVRGSALPGDGVRADGIPEGGSPGPAPSAPTLGE